MSPNQIISELRTARAETQKRLETNIDSLRTSSEAGLAQRLQAATSALQEAKRQRQKSGRLFDRFRPSKILEERRLDLRISELELEIAALNHIREERSARQTLQVARDNANRLSLVPTQRVIQSADLECRKATAAIRKFDQRWAPDRLMRELISKERTKLMRAQQKECAEARILAQRRQAGLQAARVLKDRQAQYEAARQWAAGEVADVSKGIPTALISNILKWAALALAAIIALPLLLRLLFYFVLAPLAERRPAIRLPLARATNTSIPLPRRSQTSTSVTIREGEELLVRQGFLQATSETGQKQTRWLLDWHHPFSSIASGMKRHHLANELDSPQRVQSPQGRRLPCASLPADCLDPSDLGHRYDP